MGNSLFKLTSLNLNGIRSAASKGVEAWLAQDQAGLYLRAGSQGPGRRTWPAASRSWPACRGHFHFAEKKGYSGVGVYTRHAPSDVRDRLRLARVRRRGPLRGAALRHAAAQAVASSAATFPSGSSGEERQQAKFRFLDELDPHLARLKARARVHPVRRRQHRAPGDGPEELAQQPEEQRLPARGARLDDKAAGRNGPGRRVPPPASPTPPRSATRGGATAARPGPRTWAGGWTTTWPRPRSPRLARQEAIYQEGEVLRPRADHGRLRHGALTPGHYNLRSTNG